MNTTSLNSSFAYSIAVTGATGVIGNYVARELSAEGTNQRLLVRNPERAPQLQGATIHPFSYSDKAAAIRALTGVETLLMVSAAESADRLDQHRTFIDAAVTAGVRHIVYTSIIAAAPDAVFTLARDHYTTEEYIKASGMTWTLLRDSYYMDHMEALAGAAGVIQGPAACGRVAIVSRADIARAAAAVIRDPSRHAGRTYDITGPEALTFAEVAATVSRIRGRQIRFQDETLEEAYASRASYNAPAWEVEAWVSYYQAIASNDMSVVSKDVETITGTAPQTLNDHLVSTPR